MTDESSSGYTLAEDDNEVVIILDDDTVHRLTILKDGWIRVTDETPDEVKSILNKEDYRYEKKDIVEWPVEVTQSYRREDAVYDALWQDEILADPSELDLDEVATEIYVTFQVDKDGTVQITNMRAWPEP